MTNVERLILTNQMAIMNGLQIMMANNKDDTSIAYIKNAHNAIEITSTFLENSKSK